MLDLGRFARYEPGRDSELRARDMYSSEKLGWLGWIRNKLGYIGVILRDHNADVFR